MYRVFFSVNLLTTNSVSAGAYCTCMKSYYTKQRKYVSRRSWLNWALRSNGAIWNVAGVPTFGIRWRLSLALLTALIPLFNLAVGCMQHTAVSACLLSNVLFVGDPRLEVRSVFWTEKVGLRLTEVGSFSAGQGQAKISCRHPQKQLIPEWSHNTEVYICPTNASSTA